VVLCVNTPGYVSIGWLSRIEEFNPPEGQRGAVMHTMITYGMKQKCRCHHDDLFVFGFPFPIEIHNL